MGTCCSASAPIAGIGRGDEFDDVHSIGVAVSSTASHEAGVGGGGGGAHHRRTSRQGHRTRHGLHLRPAKRSEASTVGPSAGGADPAGRSSTGDHSSLSGGRTPPSASLSKGGCSPPGKGVKGLGASPGPISTAAAAAAAGLDRSPAASPLPLPPPAPSSTSRLPSPGTFAKVTSTATTATTTLPSSPLRPSPTRQYALDPTREDLTHPLISLPPGFTKGALHIRGSEDTRGRMIDRAFPLGGGGGRGTIASAQRRTNPVISSGDELFTDTFQISATTLSDGGDDLDEVTATSWVDVSLPTQSMILDPQFRDRTMRTLSDMDTLSEFELTTTNTLERNAAQERRLSIANRERERQLFLLETESRARIVNVMTASRRMLTTKLCTQLFMYERSAMLRGYFHERLSLLLRVTVPIEALNREYVRQTEDDDWRALHVRSEAQTITDLMSRGSSNSNCGKSLVVKTDTPNLSEGGTMAVAKHSEIDLTSSGSVSEADEGPAAAVPHLLSHSTRLMPTSSWPRSSSVERLGTAPGVASSSSPSLTRTRIEPLYEEG